MTIFLCRPDGVKFRKFRRIGYQMRMDHIEGVPPGQFDNGCCRDFCQAAEYLMRVTEPDSVTVNGYILRKEK